MQRSYPNGEDMKQPIGGNSYLKEPEEGNKTHMIHYPSLMPAGGYFAGFYMSKSQRYHPELPTNKYVLKD
jgi:hypothetical protein